MSAKAQQGGAAAEYAAAFEARPGEWEPEKGFPEDMPYYFKHTARFHNHQHARALMRLRCCSAPFAACATAYKSDTRCTRCTTGAHETPEHVLFHCTHTADLRALPRFADLFPSPNLRAFATQQHQHRVAAYVHACFEKWESNPSPTP